MIHVDALLYALATFTMKILKYIDYQMGTFFSNSIFHINI